MNISIGGDHAGFSYKQEIVVRLRQSGHTVVDMGPFSEDSVDYPDFAHPVSTAVETGKSELGILICGSGNGVAITANKHQQIRAALCWKKEIAALARQHNNANILCLPARFVSIQEAIDMVEVFIATSFEGGRHGKRVDKIACA